jgi:hypothetical protein
MLKWSLLFAMGVMVGCGSDDGDSSGGDENGGTSQSEGGRSGGGGHSGSGGTASGGESGSGGTSQGGTSATGGSNSGGTSTGGTNAGGAQSFATTADENCKIVDVNVSACPENAVYGWGDCLNKPSDDCFVAPSNLAWCCPSPACSRFAGADMGNDATCEQILAGSKAWICQTATPGTENCTPFVGGVYCCP